MTEVHDRVQETAYATIASAQHAAAHLRIGRLLAEHLPSHLPEQVRSDAIFDVVNHFNRATELIDSAPERVRVAELNLPRASVPGRRPIRRHCGISRPGPRC